MKRIFFSIICIQCSNAIPTFLFGPMQAAPPISQGALIEVSLVKRQSGCTFGVPCGVGCATQGPCCDNDLGISCRAGEACVTIDGEVACCPLGTICNSISNCLNANDPACISGNSGSSFCCDSSAPFCNTSGALQICQETMATESFSSSTTTTITTKITTTTVVTMTNTIPGNLTVTSAITSTTSLATISSTNQSIILSQTVSSLVIVPETITTIFIGSAETQQLIATSVLSFSPLNTVMSPSAKASTTSSKNLTTSTSLNTKGVVISGEKTIATTTATSGGTITVSSTTVKISTDLGPTLQLNPTHTVVTNITRTTNTAVTSQGTEAKTNTTGTNSTSPALFTGGSSRVPGLSELTVAIFTFAVVLLF